MDRKSLLKADSITIRFVALDGLDRISLNSTNTNIIKIKISMSLFQSFTENETGGAAGVQSHKTKRSKKNLDSTFMVNSGVVGMEQLEGN